VKKREGVVRRVRVAESPTEESDFTGFLKVEK